MHEIAYDMRGFITIRRDSSRVPLRGSLAVQADLDSGLFTGDLVLRQSTIGRTVLGARLFSATVHIVDGSPVIGRLDGGEGRVVATAMVDAVIADVRAGARWSARRVLLHVIAETAQHAGHADIIRESLDGAKSME